MRRADGWSRWSTGWPCALSAEVRPCSASRGPWAPRVAWCALSGWWRRKVRCDAHGRRRGRGEEAPTTDRERSLSSRRRRQRGAAPAMPEGTAPGPHAVAAAVRATLLPSPSALHDEAREAHSLGRGCGMAPINSGLHRGRGSGCRMGTAMGLRGQGEQGHTQGERQTNHNLDCARRQAHRLVRSTGTPLRSQSGPGCASNRTRQRAGTRLPGSGHQGVRVAAGATAGLR